jgi:hypothetical protein
MLLLHLYAAQDLHTSWPRHPLDAPSQACHMMEATDHALPQPSITREPGPISRVRGWWMTLRRALA